MTSTVYQNNQNYIDFILHLADTNLILAQRLCEWCGHGPILEQDIAMSNMALDLLGQTSNYYDYAAEMIGNGATEDTLFALFDSDAVAPLCFHLLNIYKHTAKDCLVFFIA